MSIENTQITPPKKSLAKRLKKWFLAFGLFVFFILIVGIVLGYIYEDDIKKYALSSINAELKNDIQIDEKDISFSFITSFPKASLTLKNVVIPSSFKNDTLLKADRVSLKFGILKLLSGDYIVDKITIDDGKASVGFNENGKGNFEILKEAKEEDTTSSSFQFDIDNVRLNDIDIHYFDNQNKQSAALAIKKGQLIGSFSDQKTELTFRSRQVIKHVTIDSNTVFKDKESSLNLDFNYTDSTQNLKFNEGTLAIEKMIFSLTGYYNLKSSTYDLATTTENVQLSDVFTLFPDELANKLKEYKSDAIIESESSFSKTKGTDFTNIKSKFAVNKGTLTEKNTNASVNDLTILGDYKLTRNTQFITIEKIKGNLSGGNFEGSLKAIGKSKMSIFSDFKMNVDLKSLASFLNLERVESVDGKLSVNNELKGTYFNNEFNLTQLSGTTQLTNVSLKLVGKKYSLANLGGDFNFNRFTSSGTFKGDYGESDFAINCQVQNLVEHIIDNKPLIINSYIQSDRLNLNEILSLSDSEESEEIDTNFYLPENISTTFTTNIGTLLYAKHELNQLTGKILISPWQVDASNLSFKANGGIYSMKANLKPLEETKYKLVANVIAGNIDVKDFFERFDNFGQDVLEARHIKGRADAIINLNTELTKGLSVITPSLDVQTDFTISKGELIDFELFEEMAAYIKSNAIAKKFVQVDQLSTKLQHIYFDELQNTLTIKDSKIILPNMYITSSAMDVGVYGEQDFDDNIKYGINFRLRDVLVKDKPSEYGYIVDDGEGRRMYLSVVGTLDNPEFKFDAEARKEAKKEKIAEEKNKIKSILNKEFGLFKNSTDPTESVDPNEPAPAKVEIDWEDDNNSTEKVDESTDTKKKKKIPKWIQKITGDDGSGTKHTKSKVEVEE